MLTTFFRDLRFAVRNLWRTPGFSVVAVVTLALGVGANTAIFSVVNGVMLRPLPYEEPEQLMIVQGLDQSDGSVSYAHSQPDIYDIQSEVGAIEAAAGFQTTSFTLTGADNPELIRGSRVTNGLFEVFHVAPTLGRDLRKEENVPGAPLVAVIGHAFWLERYGGTADVIGKTIELSARTYEIVGVAPAGFDYPRTAQIWIPSYHNLDGCARGCHFLRLIARLVPRVTKETAQIELSALSSRLQDEYTDTNFGLEFRLMTLADRTYGSVRTGLWVMLGAVGLVLLIACANVANLLLVRGTARTGEVAVRAALGASRGQLVSQLLIEALALALVGGALGVALARAGLGALLRMAPSNLPRVDEISIDGTVLAFALGTVTLITLLFGLFPALRLANTSVSEALNNSGRGDGATPTRAWSRSALLVGEIALSLMLLFGAGLLLRSFAELNGVRLGFDKESVLTFAISLPNASYGADESVQFFDQLETRLEAIPGIESVGSVLGSPLGNANVGGSFRLMDRPEPPPGQEPGASVRAVTNGYLKTLGVPLLRGRGFEASDRIDSRPVVVVSQRFVDRHYPDKDPLGQQIEMHVSFGYSPEDPHTIVGVVSDIRSRDVRNDPIPEIYVTQAQAGTSYLRVLARLAPGAGEVLPAIRRELRAIDSNIPLRGVETLETTVERAYGPARFYLLLLVTFAGVAVALAAIGLYGVISYLVSRRTREIGIRMALGAESTDVMRLVLRQGLRPVALGIVVGLVGAVGAARVLQSLLYNVQTTDPVTFTAVTALLLVVTVLAILVPARRASRIPPVVALRE